MDSSEKKQKLRELIQGSMFLDRKLKDELLADLDLAGPEELAVIEEAFTEAEKQQNQLVEKMVEHDDTFLTRLKQFKASTIRKYQKKVEKSERKKEQAEEILKKIQ